jgi:transcriptional regulator with XRE-family HTH domain
MRTWHENEAEFGLGADADGAEDGARGDSVLGTRVGAMLARMRERAGFSQDALAVALGHDQSFVSRIERGERRVTVVEMLRFAAALGVTFEGLVDELEGIWAEDVHTESIWRRERP